VRLVYDEQADRRREARQHVVAKARVVEPLGADQEQVDRAGAELRAHLLPVLAVGAVDRVRAQPEPLGGGDLVAHQREQRADDQRRPGAGFAQQRGGDEVDRGLAPPRALDAEHARAVADEVADRLELVGAEVRRGVACEGAEALEGGGVDRGRGGGHDSHPRSPHGQRRARP
jgi:hypothetical protein